MVNPALDNAAFGLGLDRAARATGPVWARCRHSNRDGLLPRFINPLTSALFQLSQTQMLKRGWLGW
jgi:hypothetical protein